MPPFRWSVITQEVPLQVDQLVAVLLQHRQGCVQLPVDAPLDGIPYLTNVALRLATQFRQLLCCVQSDTQEEQDFLVVELQVHHDLPQVLPLGQVVHHKQASVEIIVKLAPADLPEGRLAHAMRQDVTARERAAFQRYITTQRFII